MKLRNIRYDDASTWTEHARELVCDSVQCDAMIEHSRANYQVKRLIWERHRHKIADEKMRRRMRMGRARKGDLNIAYVNSDILQSVCRYQAGVATVPATGIEYSAGHWELC